MGVGETFHPTPVGVFFGGPGADPGEPVADPYFGGVGPARNPCRNCGECMTGCRHNAKNTLVKNYLWLAEQHGAVVHPLTTVTRVRPREGGGYEVTARWTKAKLSRRTAVRPSPPTRWCSPPPRSAPRSCSTGSRPRATCRGSPTGSATSPAPTPSRSSARSHPTWPSTTAQGVAITSSFHPDADTHIEPVRYGRGSNFMALMQTVLTDGDGPLPRWRTWLARAVDAADARARPLRREALVGAHRHRAGDAVARQLDHDVPAQDAVRVADDVAAGPRPAEPDLDPGRQRRRTPDGAR